MATEHVKRSGDTLSDMLFEAAVRTRHSFNAPWGRRGARPRYVWIWAVILAVAWHAFWWLALTPRRVPLPFGSSTAVRVTYLPAKPANGAEVRMVEEARMVSSPVLFALPTPMGFSGPVLAKELALRPPVEASGDSALILPSPLGEATLPTVPSAPRVRAGEVRAWSALVPSSPPVFARIDREPRRGRVDVEFSAELLPSDAGTERTLEMGDVPEARAWEAVAYVVVDEQGKVLQLFMEPPAPSPAWNALLVQALRRLEFEPATASRRGRLFLQYHGEDNSSPETDEEVTE
jgi:hypothetical protein